MSVGVRQRVRFDRNEVSGAFGDIGTDFPLIVGMVLAAGLDAAGVLIMFGAMQVFTGLFYGIPMPAQPLKAMAVIVITQQVTGGVLFGGGLAVGVLMLVLVFTGLIDWLAVVVPRSVIRGIQFGLGLQLAVLALGDYVHAGGIGGYVLAGLAFLFTLTLLGNRRFPPAPLLIAMGVIYALLFIPEARTLPAAVGFRLPAFQVPSLTDVAAGLVLLALPQIPLSLGNSILATRQIIADFYPDRTPPVRKIGLTYAVMNLVNPLFGGIPTCHGSGGLAGHHAFGARTGGSVVIYGGMFILLGLFLSGGFDAVVHLFPRPVLGVILLFEGVVLMRLVRDVAGSTVDLSVSLLVAVAALTLPYGYLIGAVVGTLMARGAGRWNWLGGTGTGAGAP